jgi:hypothetical protein
MTRLSDHRLTFIVSDQGEGDPTIEREKVRMATELLELRAFRDAVLGYLGDSNIPAIRDVLETERRRMQEGNDAG